jgi:S1-C subfamily serine protease
MKKYVKLCLVMTMLSINRPNASCQDFKAEVIENTKKCIVVVKSALSRKAYGPMDGYDKGVGCIVDKSKGIILTTRSIVGNAAIGTYNITFYNGEQADAKLCYYDPWLECAFLKVLPEDIPDDTTIVTFSNAAPEMNQPVFVVSNNEGKGVSMHIGNVSSIHEVIGSMPQHAINVSFDTKNSAIGTPIVDAKGQAVGLHYAGSTTFGTGLHPAYVRYALSFIRKDKIPVRKHIGVITGAYSLNDGMKYRNFPKAEIKTYVKQFPTALGNAIQVVRVLQGTPADGKLLAGDILWAVDGQVIGPNLVTLDMAMNNAHASQVRLTICRNGEWLDIGIPLYDLEDHKVTRMVSFGGALFFETDDIFSDKVGLLPGTLTFASTQATTTFVNIPHVTRGESMCFLLELCAIADTKIGSLSQLVQYIPQLIKQRYFTVDYATMFPQNDSLSEFFGQRVSQRYVCKADIAYDINSPEPRLFTFNRTQMEWTSKLIQ